MAKGKAKMVEDETTRHNKSSRHIDASKLNFDEFLQTALNDSDSEAESEGIAAGNSDKSFHAGKSKSPAGRSEEKATSKGKKVATSSSPSPLKAAYKNGLDSTVKSSVKLAKPLKSFAKESSSDIDTDDADEAKCNGGISSADNDALLTKHKQSLNKLKESDPEFYNYLQQNDEELLNFESDSSDESGDNAEDRRHMPPDSLEVASDDEEFDSEDESKESDGSKPSATGQSNVLTNAKVREWQNQIQNKCTVQVLVDVVNGFEAAVAMVDDELKNQCAYVVKDSMVFNSVIRLCVLDLESALMKILSPSNEKIRKVGPACKGWNKVKSSVKTYVNCLTKLLVTIAAPHLVSVLLKHIHSMIPYFLPFPKARKQLAKQLVKIWSHGEEESVRVLAYFCLVKMLRTEKEEMLDWILKSMYLAYVQNTKFTSVSTWPVINFMRVSLVELLALEPRVAYRHAFLYIRQLAIHLRNGYTLKKKEYIQAVYNWQYVHLLHLWTNFVCNTFPDAVLKPLIYPLVQIIIGTIKLSPSPRYYPLRFHLIKFLIRISDQAKVHIPLSPFIIEVLREIDMSKKNTRTSMKPLDFGCILRLSKSQMAENGFKDAVMENAHDLLLEYLSTQSSTIAFPELTLLIVIRLKEFLKVCKIANYGLKFKQLLDKIVETNAVVEKRRSNFNAELNNLRAVENWERDSLKLGTPLTTFYTEWKKLRDKEVLRRTLKTDLISDFDLPTLKRKALEESKEKDREDFSDLFNHSKRESDSEEGDSDGSEGSDDINARFLSTAEKKALKEASKQQNEDVNDSSRRRKKQKVDDSPKTKKQKVMGTKETASTSVAKLSATSSTMSSDDDEVKMESDDESDCVGAADDIVEEMKLSDSEDENRRMNQADEDSDESSVEELEDESLDDSDEEDE